MSEPSANTFAYFPPLLLVENLKRVICRSNDVPINSSRRPDDVDCT